MTAPSPAPEVVEAAWLAYREQYLRLNPWNDARRAARQMRKRDFIAGYQAAALAALPVAGAGLAERWWISDGPVKSGGEKILGPFESRDLALNVRRLYEAHADARGLTFWVSEESDRG